MSDITPEMATKYLNKGGENCLYCGTFDTVIRIDTLDCVPTWSDITEIVRCKKCGRKWENIYSLSGVEVFLDE